MAPNYRPYFLKMIGFAVSFYWHAEAGLCNSLRRKTRNFLYGTQRFIIMFTTVYPMALSSA
jgi:hypothetical protein